MKSTFALFTALLLAPSALLHAADEPKPLQMGHRDFVPSGERPVGLRGDGTGAWPGANPVAEWNAVTGKNIVWKTPMPGPSFSQPIIVGDKVFTLADPNWLICISAIDGKILWQRAVDHTSNMPPEKAAKAREEMAFWEDLFRQYSIWLDLKHGYTTKLSQAQIDRALKAADEHGFAVNGPGQANFSMMTLRKKGRDPLWERLWQDQTDYSLYYFGHWEGILTQTFPTPVSDGEHVFVNMSNDQVACYDLEGNCRWLIWDRPAEAKPAESEHVRYALSPRLCGDKLIVTACGEMRAYDKHTGRKLWGVFHKKDFGSYWTKVGLPVPMRLKLDGKPFDILLSPGSGIYRLSDGKLVGSLPILMGYEGSTAITDGEIYVRRDAPDGGGSKRVAGRFEVLDADHVEFKELWRKFGGGKSHNTTDVLSDGWIYSPASALRVELRTGEAEELPLVREQTISPSLGGKLLVCLSGGEYQRWGARKKEPGVMQATIIPLEDPTKATTLASAFIDRRYEEDEAFRLRWRWRGNGDPMSNSSPVFHANRMFYRTVGYLWCVGDPADPWPSHSSARKR
jgi:outer membrane protein assembly factor BamB